MEKWFASGLLGIFVGLVIGSIITGIIFDVWNVSEQVEGKKNYWITQSLGGQPHIVCNDFWGNGWGDYSCETESVAEFFEESLAFACVAQGVVFESVEDKQANCLAQKYGCLESCSFMYETNLYEECKDFGSTALSEACEESCRENFDCAELQEKVK